MAFDAEDILAGLRPWVECESPSFDAAAVNRMMTLASRDFALAGAHIDRIPGRLGFGDCVRARFPHPKASEQGILVLCHLDTVHPVGTLAALPFRRDGGRCYGPAILDMKGGTYTALRALKALQQAGIATQLPVTFLLTSDEEAGTTANRDLILAEASRHCFILAPERCPTNGGVISSRAGIARFSLDVRGKPSHALAAASAGSSAVREMARRVLEIDGMTSPASTFAVGVIKGGQWVNCVPIACHAESMVVAKTQNDLDDAIARMHALAGTVNGATLIVTHTNTRPLWKTNPASLALYEQVRTIAASIGQTIPLEPGGGGSDGNITGVAGFATIDGLGLRGDGLHTLEEHIEVSSLAERASLMAALFQHLSPPA
ncbi:M20/M25/M40 family metallo-hydrolase [Aquabacter sp. CN5-332]|uniref:M20/M25/M40 family metallo-hydrolase n=1 Tax=Aquabacter sp. CN5-332 TaxID=3156608 RepID=UPI0032B59054